MTFNVFSNLCFVFLIFLFCLNASNTTGLTDEDKNEQIIKNLYTEEDKVVVLNSTNFNGLFYGQNNSWAIEFHKGLCEFCLHFSISWRRLALDVHQWRNSLKIGSVDCANNTAIYFCKYIEETTDPVIRYFHENYPEGTNSSGDSIPRENDAGVLRKTLLRYIVNEQENGRAKNFPNIKPFTSGKLSDLYNDTPSDTKYLVLMVERQNDSIGVEVTMDLQDLRHIVVKYAYTDNTDLLNRLKITIFPSVMIFSSSKSFIKLTQPVDTRSRIKTAVKHFLLKKKPQPFTKLTHLHGTTARKRESLTSMEEGIKEQYKFNLRQRIKTMKGPFFLMDIETALRWSFKRDIASIDIISDDRFDALIDYMTVLIKYFPFGRKGHQFMMELRDLIIETHGKIAGNRILAIFISVEEHHKDLFSNPEEWLACDKGNPGFGLYPCGLWQLFHYLTVKSAQVKHYDDNGDSREVLLAIQGYVRYFINCAYCAESALKIIEEEDIKDVNSLDSAIIWLWTLHNIVNENENKKNTQFPTPQNCPTCRKVDNTWNMKEVLRYIKHVYSNGTQAKATVRGHNTTVQDTLTTDAVKALEILGTTTRFLLYLIIILLTLSIIRMFVKSGYRMKPVHKILAKS